jgi:plasmid maintenance system killer protein
VQLVRFRHKGLRQLYEDGKAQGVPPALVDKLSKLLLAIENCEDVGAARSISGLAAASAERRPQRIVEPYRYRKLAG